KKGGANKSLITGEAGRLNMNSVSVSIKAELDARGKFNLYSRLDTESDFHPEGSCDIQDAFTSSWFGIVCTFSSSRNEHFFFDNFVVGVLNDDEPGGNEPGGNEFEALPREVIINEILFDAPTGGNEYVELYNRSDKVLDLRYLSITSRKPSDGSFNTVYPLSAEPLLLQPQEYVVVTKNRELVCQFFNCREESFFTEPSSMPPLSDESGCAVILNNRTNEMVDQFYYSASMHSKGTKKDGVALERIHYDLPTDEAGSWASATSQSGYGTPGYVNSQYSESTGIISPDKNSVTIEYPALGDDRYGIRYSLDQSGYNGRLFIYDASGRKVSTILDNDVLGRQGIIYWNGQGVSGRKLSPGIYIVYLEVFDMSGVGYKFKTPVVVR
ncbi:MAG: lamin tail domain-containing protein, partial [Dysgonamonadaceae bacterium]|nr:lamin tail domain-containing protein [Dysgonamonadaceae bacterium]